MSKKNFVNLMQKKHKEFVQFANATNYYKKHNIENFLTKEYK
nr:MAG TPA: hypothetical protein [Caudoviricetes sp.]